SGPVQPEERGRGPAAPIVLAGRSVSRDPAHRGMRIFLVRVLVVQRVVIVVVRGIAFAEIRVRLSFVLLRADTQLGPQPVKVSAAAVVLELTGYLHLLGLGSAAPHWLDPLERTGPNGPLVTALKVVPTMPMRTGFPACQTGPPSSAMPGNAAQR